MAILKCKMCAGDLEVIEGVTICECLNCGRKQTVPSLDNEKKVALFTRANKLRFGCEFDKASGVYESIVADFPEEAEAYWGLVLCRYGIEYVDDPITGNKIPTCHRSSFDSVFDDSDFEMVMECSDPLSRNVYREEAKAIEGLRVGIIEVSSKEEPYDIFICYKETSEDGQRTLDSVLAQDVYDALISRGYKVFFSRITLEDKLGVEYEPYIFAALNSAPIMLAFGTNYEYYNAVWVKNEWSRFLSLIAKGEKKTLIPCYKDIDAYDMPSEFMRLQAQDLGKVGAIQDLLRGIEKIIGKKGESATSMVVTGNVGALTKRGYLYLEDKDFAKAIEYFEKALDENPEDGNAYLGAVLAKSRIQTLDELETMPISLQSIPYYSKAIRFSSGSQKTRLQSILDENKKKVGNNRELANNVVNGDIKKVVSLAPILLTVVENLKAYEYEETLGISKAEVDKALIKYDVFRVLETSDGPMNTKEIKAASVKLGAVDNKLIRSALVEINNAGYISFANQKFWFISDGFKAERKKEYKSKFDDQLTVLKKNINDIDSKITELTNQISYVRKNIESANGSESELLAEAESKKAAQIAERRQKISGMQAYMQQLNGERNLRIQEYNSLRANLSYLFNQKIAMENELNSLSFMQGKRKKELQASIAAIMNQMAPLDRDYKAKESELVNLDRNIIDSRNSIELLNNEILYIEKNGVATSNKSVVQDQEKVIVSSEANIKELQAKKKEYEASLSQINEQINSYEWMPESITEDFDDGTSNFNNDDILANYIKAGDKIGAIKYYRNQTGKGLSESRVIVEAMFAEANVTPISRVVSEPTATINNDQSDSGSDGSVEEYVLTHFTADRKMSAIKYYKDHKGVGLKEAKEAVERLLNC